jgi:DNA-binding transcriptional MerR regulator
VADRAHLTIGEVLSLLREEFPDVSISKIRFLESQGLVDPERTPSGYRKFYDHDVARLRWILQQQREHFLPLKVIKGRLSDAAEAPPGVPVAAESEVAAAGDVAAAADEPAPADEVPARGVGPAPDGRRAAVPPGAGAAPAARAGAAASSGMPPAVSTTRSPAGAHAAPAGPGSGLPAATPEAVAGEREVDEQGGGAQGGGAQGGWAQGGGAPGGWALGGGAQGGGASSGGSGPAGEGASPAWPAGTASSAGSSSTAPRTASSTGERRSSAGRVAPVAAAAPEGSRPPTPGSSAPRAGAGAQRAGRPGHVAVPLAVPAAGRPAGVAAVPPGPPRPSSGSVRPAAPAPSAPAPPPAARSIATATATNQPDVYTTEELALSAGCEAALVVELQQYGLLVANASVGGVAYFDEDAIGIARTGARFAAVGVEPRHLRAWRNAADREASLFEQLVMPLLRQRNPQARTQAAALLEELVSLGGDLRSGLIREAVRSIK